MPLKCDIIKTSVCLRWMPLSKGVTLLNTLGKKMFFPMIIGGYFGYHRNFYLFIPMILGGYVGYHSGKK